MKPKKTIYLDYAAATPLDPSVKEVMQPYETADFYNPSSLYQAARRVRQDLEEARGLAARQLGAKPTEIIFTAGGTESVNLALQGVLTSFPNQRFLTTTIEHEAVLATFAQLRGRGHVMDLVPVSAKGLVSPAGLASAVDDSTVLVSVMYANNEIGTVQPVAAIAKELTAIKTDRAKRGIKLPLYLHSDACQAAGALDLSVSRLGVDLLTLNGSKIYGPKQTGLLYVRHGTRLTPLIHGGGQEQGLRSGTENVAGFIGLATALALAQTKRQADSRRLAALRDQLIASLLTIGGITLNGDRHARLPGNINVSIAGIDGEQAVLYLDNHGVQASTGSACTTGRTDPSHVLLAIGLSLAQANASLRLTLGRGTSAADIDRVGALIHQLVPRLRQLANQAG